MSELAHLVVSLRDTKFCVRIDRATKWGNPFPAEGRDNASLDYAKWLRDGGVAEGYKCNYIAKQVLADIESLRGTQVGCWCSPRRCHGEILVRLANRIGDLHDELDTVIEELEQFGRLFPWRPH